MESVESKVIEWAMNKIKSYESEKKLYNLSAIILSILDVICGVISIFYTTMSVTSVIASIICGTVWGGRVIQLIKAERLAKALKVMSTASIAYMTVRKRRSEYMKKFFDNLKNNPLTIVFALIGGVLMGFATYEIAQKYFTLPNYVYIVFAVLVSIITVVLVVLLGWDNLKSAILRSAKKTLSKDGYDTLVGYVNVLKSQEDKQAELDAQTEAHDKELEQARIIIADYEKRNTEYQKALELLNLHQLELQQQKDITNEAIVETIAEDKDMSDDEQTIVSSISDIEYK